MPRKEVMPHKLSNKLPDWDKGLMDTLLKFANLKPIKSQEQVYKLWRDYVCRGEVHAALQLNREIIDRLLADPEALRQELLRLREQLPPAGVQPYMARLPESVGVEPFVEDQKAIRRALDDIIDERDVNDLLDLVQAKLRDKLHGSLNISVKRGALRIVGAPALDGNEACCWYAVALMFHHEREGLLRRCEARLANEEKCNRFFWYTPSLRVYCSAKHAELDRPKAAVRAVQKSRDKNE